MRSAHRNHATARPPPRPRHLPSGRGGANGFCPFWRCWRWRLGLWFWPGTRTALFGPAPAAGFVTVSGNIEAHESLLSFTQVQAPIVFLPFDEGATVAAGTVLARVDDRLYRQQVQIDASNLQVQAAQVTQSENNLAAAQSNVASTRDDLAQKQSDAARADRLVQTNAVSVQDRDRAQTAARQSAAALAHDQAMVLVGAVRG